jgi:hypothetical protein
VSALHCSPGWSELLSAVLGTGKLAAFLPNPGYSEGSAGRTRSQPRRYTAIMLMTVLHTTCAEYGAELWSAVRRLTDCRFPPRHLARGDFSRARIPAYELAGKCRNFRPASKLAGERAAASCRTRAPESAPGWRSESPLQVHVTCNRLQLRRGDTGWGAAGGERPVRTLRNSIRPVRWGEPASEGRSPEFPLGAVPWGSHLGSTGRGVTCSDEAERPQVIGDGMAGRPGA